MLARLTSSGAANGAGMSQNTSPTNRGHAGMSKYESYESQRHKNTAAEFKNLVVAVAKIPRHLLLSF